MRHNISPIGMIDLLVKDETSKLEAVVLGIAKSTGGVPSLDEAYDPKSKQHIIAGTFPEDEALLPELAAFEKVLKKYDVEVYRPDNIQNLNQIFSRDIGYVIDDKLVVPNIIAEREAEKSGLYPIIEHINKGNVLHMPAGAHSEGGDVMPWKGKLFVGYEEAEDFEKYKVSRTNKAGVDFLKNSFPNYEVHAFELNKSDDNALDNALHLDCCFQPIGNDMCIIYEGGFKNKSDFDYLVSFFGEDKCIQISQQEMYEMNSNVFSIAPDVIVSEQTFTRLNAILRDKGFTVEAIPYNECAKMEGLLRCSTMPLRRKN